MADQAQMSDSERKKEDWMNSKWRPMMGWLYMIVCAFDFILFPIMYAMVNAVTYKGMLPPGVPAQWQPLTLQGAGLFHMAMGAVLGIAAFGRTQEKIAGVNNGSTQSMATGQPTTFSQPTANSFAASATSSFGSTGSARDFSSGGFGSIPAQSASTGIGNGVSITVATTASGKKIVPDEAQPLL